MRIWLLSYWLLGYWLDDSPWQCRHRECILCHQLDVRALPLRPNQGRPLLGRTQGSAPNPVDGPWPFGTWGLVGYWLLTVHGSSEIGPNFGLRATYFRLLSYWLDDGPGSTDHSSSVIAHRSSGPCSVLPSSGVSHLVVLTRNSLGPPGA